MEEIFLKVINFDVFYNYGYKMNGLQMASSSSDFSSVFLVILFCLLMGYLWYLESDTFREQKKEKLKAKGKAYLDYSVNENGEEIVGIEAQVFQNDKGFNLSLLEDALEKLFKEIYYMLQSGETYKLEKVVSEEVLSLLMETYKTRMNDRVVYDYKNLKVKKMSLHKYFQKDAYTDILSLSIEYEIGVKQNGDGCFTTQYKRVALRLGRECGVQTPAGKVAFLTNCLNCGAAIQQWNTSSCKYCGSLLPANAFNWEVVFLQFGRKKE